MSRAGVLFGKCAISRPSRRDITTSLARTTSTSPQRQAAPAPAMISQTAKPFTDIPGPLALPMLRHSYHVLPRIGSFHHTVGLGLLEGLRNRYGDLVRLAKASRTRPVLYVFDPEMMQEVYDSHMTEPPVWDRSPLREQRKVSGTGTHCPIRGGEKKAVWAAIRAILLDGTLLSNYDEAFNGIAADATRRLGELRKAENALNEEIETEMYRWALETIGVMIFGIRLGCLDGPVHFPTQENRTPEKTSMDDQIPDLCSLSKRPFEELSPAERLVRCSREIAEQNYLVRNENTLKPESEIFQNALKTLDKHFSLTEYFYVHAIKNLHPENLRPEQVLLDKLRPLERRILPLATDVILAGVDPLAQTAISMFYQLSLYAAQQQRAHDEISWAAAAVNAGASCPEMTYVNACAREAMRLHPATGGVVRRNRDSIVVGGYEVPPGVDIVLAHGVSSKSDKQYGRSKAFVPERWTETWSPLRASRAHPLASLPFGESCPATGVVNKMLATLSTRVLEKYRLEWHGPAPNLITTGVNKLQSPFYFVFKDAA